MKLKALFIILTAAYVYADSCPSCPANPDTHQFTAPQFGQCLDSSNNLGTWTCTSNPASNLQACLDGGCPMTQCTGSSWYCCVCDSGTSSSSSSSSSTPSGTCTTSRCMINSDCGSGFLCCGGCCGPTGSCCGAES